MIALTTQIVVSRIGRRRRTGPPSFWASNFASTSRGGGKATGGVGDEGDGVAGRAGKANGGAGKRGEVESRGELTKQQADAAGGDEAAAG